MAVPAQRAYLDRFRELARRAAFRGETAFTRFLEPAWEEDARAVARETGAKVAFFGGHEDAERRIAAFWSDVEPEEREYPLECLEARWSAKFSSPGHRDFLGALMGLGVVRESLGDIAVLEGRALMIVHRDVAGFVRASLESVGRASVRVESFSGEMQWPAPAGETLTRTVAQLRLDAVLAAGYNLSREEAQAKIRSGLVKRNHQVELRGDFRLQEGDLLSVRGMGRLILQNVGAQTKKGRIAIRLFRMGK